MNREKFLALLSLVLIFVLAVVGYWGQRQMMTSKLMLSGTNKQEAGHFNQAKKDFKKALKINPNLAEAHFSLGTIYLSQKRSQAAEDELAQAVSLDDSKAEYYAYQAYLYFNQLDRREEAVKKMEKAVQLDPKNYQYEMAVAYFYKKLKQWKKSESAFKAVLKLEPDFNSARDQLAEVYNELGEPKKAARVIKEKERYTDKGSDGIDISGVGVE